MVKNFKEGSITLLDHFVEWLWAPKTSLIGCWFFEFAGFALAHDDAVADEIGSIRGLETVNLLGV